MKEYRSFVLGVVVTLLVVTAFWVGNVFAATDCFSDIASLPTVFQEAICWMKDNGVTSGYPDGTYRPNGTVTRAQMALFMKNQAEVPPTTGLILTNAGIHNWTPHSTNSDVVFTYWGDSLFLAKTTTGSEYINLTPDFPLIQYGKSLKLLGMELCYSASTSATLSNVGIYPLLVQSGSSSIVNSYVDSSDRTDAACRYYILSTPLTLTAEHSLHAWIEVNWTTAGSNFKIYRTTFVLQPTGITAAVPAELSSDEAITLQEQPGGTLNLP